MRDSFIFYRSFFEAVSLLEPKDQIEVMMALCDYALNGTERDLTGVSAAIFMLTKPNLDSNQRRYENGKKGGRPKTKPKPNVDVDVDVDEDVNVDVDGDVDGDGDAETTGTAAAVLSVYQDKINPTPSASSLDELKGFANTLGAECCFRAFDIALDAKKTGWPYIRAILQDKQSKGVRCLADWDALEDKRRRKQELWEYDPGDTKGWSL